MRRTVLHQVLQRLRLRVVFLFAAIAAAGMAAFVVALVWVETRAENQQLDGNLKAQASRAAALMWVDQGRPMIDGVQDDVVMHGPGELVVFHAASPGTLEVLLASKSARPDAVRTLARSSLADIEELGRFATLTIDGDVRRAAALPWFDGDRTDGAVVATAPPVPAWQSRILWPALLGGTVLLLLLVLMAWVMSGRTLRPAEEAITDREHFLATAAHELRSPLARLRASAEAVRQTVPITAEGGAALHRLVGIADSAAQVVSNLLLATRIEHAAVPVHCEPVRLDRLVADLELLVPTLVADVSTEVEVDGDPSLLRHAVMNLVDNSLRHGRVGESLPTIVVTAEYRDGRPVLRISDDGPGFPPDTDVLERFVSGPGGGTGLGLSLVRWIAEQRHATVHLGGGTPPADPGATVELVFPVRDR